MQKKEDQRTLSKKRNYPIVKSNDIIRHTAFDLSVQQQKLMLYIISQIKATDKHLQPFTFDLSAFCRICGIRERTTNYDLIAESIFNLYQKSNMIKTDTKYIYYRWIESAVIDTNKKQITIQIDKFLEPYLVQLTSNFTQYQLENILTMQSKYSIRLYELLCSYKSIGEYQSTVADLKACLACQDEYTRYSNFREKVLEVALKEINTLTDLTVTYDTLRTGRTITDIIFTITIKDIVDRAAVQADRYKKLNKYSDVL